MKNNSNPVELDLLKKGKTEDWSIIMRQYLQEPAVD